MHTHIRTSPGGSPAGRPIVSYPWIVALLGALLLLCNNAYIYTFGVFFKPIAGDFGWSRGVMSGAYAARSLVCAVLVVPIGYWSDRYGPRRVLLPCFILFGISMIVMARVTTVWQLYLMQGLGMGIGTAGPFVVVLSTVAKWHSRRRGLALGLASAGLGLASVLFPPVATQMIDGFGWRWATAILGIAIMALAIPACLAMRDPPSVASAQSQFGRQRGLADIFRLVPQVLKNPAFLVIVIMFSLFYTAGNVLTNHLVNYATDIGMTAIAAAGMMSAMGVASTSGRLIMGAVSDRIGTRTDTAVCCVMVAGSFMLLATRMPSLMWLGVLVFGIGFGGASPLIPAIMGELVSRDDLATATGVGTMGAFVGSALGPWLGGFTFDVSGSYLLALLMSAAFAILALVLALSLPRPRAQIQEAPR